MIGGLHHVGLTVPDLAEAVQFFEEVLGFEQVLAGAAAGVVDEAYARAVRIPGGTEARGLAVLAKGMTRIELFEYAGGGQRRAFPANHDVGGHHFAFEVDDMEAAIARLRDAGCTIAAPVRTAQAPAFRGMQWVYAVAPFGLQLELVHFPAESF
jgi:catechol 2,3-dioxygenase-like lactoylglutathione lyase family enzyme